MGDTTSSLAEWGHWVYVLDGQQIRAYGGILEAVGSKFGQITNFHYSSIHCLFVVQRDLWIGVGD